jgi:hypothetical protein
VAFADSCLRWGTWQGESCSMDTLKTWRDTAAEGTQGQEPDCWDYSGTWLRAHTNWAGKAVAVISVTHAMAGGVVQHEAATSA